MQARKVGLLVVHGQGEQDRYQTLDEFTRSLVRALYKQTGEKVDLMHMRSRVDGDVDDSIRLRYSLGSVPIELDLHEYYWASDMSRHISFGETIEWLIQTANGAEKFYDENEILAQRYEGYQKGRRWYLKHLGNALQIVYSLRNVTRFLPGSFDPLLRKMMGKYTQVFADYFGDSAIYTTSDSKSKFYEIRQTVLDGMTRKLIGLINADYDKIIIAAHSLGSVIAYDALNQVNLEMNVNPSFAAKADKQFELITFGSPLDKVAFFLREHLREGDYIKQLVIKHVNGYRKKFLEMPSGEQYTVSSSVQDYLPHLRWINYWHPDDPISGHLDYYDCVDNIRLANELPISKQPRNPLGRLFWQFKLYGVAHTHYWSNEQIFREAINRAAENDIRKPIPADKLDQVSGLLCQNQTLNRQAPAGQLRPH